MSKELTGRRVILNYATFSNETGVIESVHPIDEEPDQETRKSLNNLGNFCNIVASVKLERGRVTVPIWRVQIIDY